MKTTIEAFGVVQGVSQQPDALRLMTQGARQENAFSSTLEGVVTRHPFEFVSWIAPNVNIHEPLVHVINRDPVERYVTLFSHQSVQVFELDGTSVPVLGPAGAADFTTYLSLETANPILSPHTFNGPNWTLNGDAFTSAAEAFVGGLGYGSARKVGSKSGATGPGEYSQAQGSFVAGPQTFSVYVRKLLTLGVFTNIRLILRDTANSLDHYCDFNWTGASGFEDLTVGAAALGAVGSVEELTHGWWRASVTFTPGTSSGGVTAVGSARSVAIRALAFNGSAVRVFDAWGAALTTGAATSPFTNDPNKYLKAITIADYTFLANTLVPTAKTGAVSATTDWTKTCYIFVLSGNYDRTYTVHLKKSGGTDKTFETKTLAGTGTWATPQTKTVSTEDIAQDICDRINSTAAGTSKNGVDYSANTIAADGWAASRVGSVVKITRASTNIEYVTIGSADGDRDLRKVWSTVGKLTELPTVMDDGVIVKIQGSLDTAADDYYVKFVSDTSSVFGPGHWEETLAPGFNTTIDGNTMPWALIRRTDDGGGTHTGTAFKKYFEWAPLTWNTRLVGDDSTNPLPSLISTSTTSRYISDIFFFKNRLGLASGQNVVMSEVSRFFNLFRTTVLTVPDNDPIDVAVPHTRVVSVNHAVPHHERLVLLSDFSNFILQGDPILSPKTVQVTPIHEFESHRYNRPVAVEQGLFFTSKLGDFSACGLLIPSEQVDSLSMFKVTTHVPKYIAGDARFMAASSQTSVLFVASETDRSLFYVYKYAFEGNEQVQSSWSKYTLGESTRILGFGFIDTTVYLVVLGHEGVVLYKSTIADGLSDRYTNYVCRVDRRVAVGPDTLYGGVFSAGSTTWTVGQWLSKNGGTIKLITRASGPYAQDGGSAFSGMTYDATLGTVSVPGDYSGVPFWIGAPIPVVFEFSRPYLKKQNPYSGGSSAPIQAVRVNIDRASVYFSDTGAFDLSVALFRRGTYTESYAPTLDTPPSLGQLVLKTDSYRFGVHCLSPEATITLSSSSHLPLKLGGIEWEVQTVSNASPDAVS